jgi:CRP-like cAMP-binding protein
MLAKRAPRTITLANGELLNEFLVRALPTLTHDLLLDATRQCLATQFAPGEAIYRPQDAADRFFVITRGEVHVYAQTPAGEDVLVDALGPGQYFGEMGLLDGGLRTVLVKAASVPVEAVALSRDVFLSLLRSSGETLQEVTQIVSQRSNRLSAHSSAG